MILAPATMAREDDPKVAARKCFEEVGLDADLYRIGHTKARYKKSSSLHMCIVNVDNLLSKNIPSPRVVIALNINASRLARTILYLTPKKLFKKTMTYRLIIIIKINNVSSATLSHSASIDPSSQRHLVLKNNKSGVESRNSERAYNYALGFADKMFFQGPCAF